MKNSYTFKTNKSNLTRNVVILASIPVVALTINSIPKPTFHPIQKESVAYKPANTKKHKVVHFKGKTCYSVSVSSCNKLSRKTRLKHAYAYVEEVGKSKGLPVGYMRATLWIESKAKNVCYSKKKNAACGWFQYIPSSFPLKNKNLRMNPILSTKFASNDAKRVLRTVQRQVPYTVAKIGKIAAMYNYHNQGGCGARLIDRVAKTGKVGNWCKTSIGKRCSDKCMMNRMVKNTVGKWRKKIIKSGSVNKYSANVFLDYKHHTVLKGLRNSI